MSQGTFVSKDIMNNPEPQGHDSHPQTLLLGEKK